MKQQYRLLVSVTLAIMLMATMLGQALAGGNEPPQPLGFWSTHTAYQVDVAFWADGQPHYAAFFSGLYGYNQHYLGPGGDAATCGSSAGCISNWTWYNDVDRNRLLLPKGGWLLTEPPWGPKWQASNYQATTWID